MTLALNYTSDLQVRSDKEEVDLNFFNRRYLSIFNALTALDARQMVFDGQVNTFVSTALQQLNNLLGPLLTQIQNASTLGFLWAKAVGTPVNLVNGEANGFRVTENAQLFTPTPVLMVQDLTDTTNWGLVTLDDGGWTKSTGDLAVHVIYATKTQVSNSWFISDSAAIFPAMNNVLAQTQSARDQALSAQSAMAANVATMNALVAQVQSGPVVSVAGKTGAVTLVEADIGGLVTDLAAKASSTSVTTQLAGKQDSAAKLTTLAGMTWAANQLLMATSTAALTGLPISAFVQTILDDVDAATVRTTIGAAATGSFPAKASSATVAAGTDDTQWVSSLGVAGTYLPRLTAFDLHTTTPYTLQSSNNGQVVRMSSASAMTVTLPNNFPVGWNCVVEQSGAGIVTFSAASGATLNTRGARNKTNGQYALASLYVTANAGGVAAIYTLAGDLST